MADTTVTHQPATESTDRTPISEIGGRLAESRGAMFKGHRLQAVGHTGGGQPSPPGLSSSLMLVTDSRRSDTQEEGSLHPQGCPAP
ncbi:unnamed protein product [Boreogadus saida]